MTPQRFFVNEGLKEKPGLTFFRNWSFWFVQFWVYVGGFNLGNESSNSYCQDLSHGFEGLQDTTLTGMNGTWDLGPYHHCARIVAVQLS